MHPDAGGAERLWARLARPFDPLHAAEAMLGMSHGAVRTVAASRHATSPEVIALLFQMPLVLRSLGVATTNRSERCQGEIRGPVQWSETMSARGATAGALDLFVCTTAARAYDTPENRILVAALRSIVEAASDLERGSGVSTTTQTGDDLARHDLARHARRNASLAVRYLDHRALSGVQQRRPTPKEMARVRAGKRARTYLPAIAVLERADESIGGLDVEGLADLRTRQEHTTLADTLDALERRGHPAPLHVRRGTLVGGPVTYAHHAHPHHPDRPGIRIGGETVHAGADRRDIELICARAGY
jgi:hypothetical protein